MAKENSAPLKGTRDFLPKDVRQREHVLKVVREVYSRYGFEPLETPAMERLETLLGKYGEEGDQLIFRILHRGAELGRSLDKIRAAPAPAAASSPEEGRAAFKRNELELADSALRYDLTVPLARVVAEYQNELPRFFKRYQIQPVWRADRPAAGRFREFYQCDVDIVGSNELVCDVEVASAVCEVLDRLGFDNYKIRLNHRSLLRGMIESSGVPADKEVDAITALDKLDKIGADGVTTELGERGISAEAAKKLLELSALPKKFTQNDALLEALSSALKGSTQAEKGLAELKQFIAYAQSTPCGKRVSLDPSLARGLSYYTGPIFEVQVPDLAGSLGGGGRYDNLIGMFLKTPIPAVGFSLGLERILVVMAERKMFPELSSSAEVMVFRLGGSSKDEAAAKAETLALTTESLAIATELRRAGFATELYPNVDKLGKQFQYAESRGAKLAVFVGEREKAAGEVAVKVLAKQEQLTFKRADLATGIGKLLGR
jgi:histidyl-tRNA synthetase